MSRLIDADKLKKMRFSQVFNDDDGAIYVPLRDVIMAINQAPTEVVCCNECKWYDKVCVFDDCAKPQDHYCAYGERKDGAE